MSPFSIIDPKEFLVVRHSVLNGNNYDVGDLVNDTLKLGKYINNRNVIPCFEGDLIQIGEARDIVFTHQNFIPLSAGKYLILREKKIATSLIEVINKIKKYLKNNDQKLILCFELKNITSVTTIYQTIKLLKESEMEDVYFDSFFGSKLDVVQRANERHGTNYLTSLHLLGNIGSMKFSFKQPKNGFDIVTVPYIMSQGNLRSPAIIGAVGSTKILEKIAQNPNIYGAYARFWEGSGVKGLFANIGNSVTNTKKRRQVNLSLYDR